ncbi:hypothetical protein [Robertmurraya massiliosenegalensis]|nr:hypothetical protein [Robertmurraya massiliosenegalensis]
MKQIIPALIFILIVFIGEIFLLRADKGSSILSNYLNKMMNLFKK